MLSVASYAYHFRRTLGGLILLSHMQTYLILLLLTAPPPNSPYSFGGMKAWRCIWQKTLLGFVTRASSLHFRGISLDNLRTGAAWVHRIALHSMHLGEAGSQHGAAETAVVVGEAGQDKCIRVVERQTSLFGIETSSPQTDKRHD